MKPAATALALLAAVAVGGAVGYRIGSTREASPATATSVSADSATRAPTTPRASPGAVGDPLDGGDFGSQSTRALRDPDYLRRLLQRYAAETDADRKGALLAVINSAPGDESLRFALDLARSTDPAARRDGLALLAAFPLDRAEVRDTLAQQLRDERDPAMQARLLDMLAPAQMAREDAAPLLRQIERLRQSPDPAVRAASVRQTAQWDRSPAAEDALHRALLDADPQVRQAGMDGVFASGLRSDRLKDALLAIASDAQAGMQQRQAAVLGLQNFGLDRGEYALYRRAADEVAAENAH